MAQAVGVFVLVRSPHPWTPGRPATATGLYSKARAGALTGFNAGRRPVPEPDGRGSCPRHVGPTDRACVDRVMELPRYGGRVSRRVSKVSLQRDAKGESKVAVPDGAVGHSKSAPGARTLRDRLPCRGRQGEALEASPARRTRFVPPPLAAAATGTVGVSAGVAQSVPVSQVPATFTPNLAADAVVIPPAAGAGAVHRWHDDVRRRPVRRRAGRGTGRRPPGRTSSPSTPAPGPSRPPSPRRSTARSGRSGPPPLPCTSPEFTTVTVGTTITSRRGLVALDLTTGAVIDA